MVHSLLKGFFGNRNANLQLTWGYHPGKPETLRCRNLRRRRTDLMTHKLAQKPGNRSALANGPMPEHRRLEFEALFSSTGHPSVTSYTSQVCSLLWGALADTCAADGCACGCFSCCSGRDGRTDPCNSPHVILTWFPQSLYSIPSSREIRVQVPKSDSCKPTRAHHNVIGTATVSGLKPT